MRYFTPVGKRSAAQNEFMALLSGLESIRVKEARRPTEAPWSAEFTQQLKDLKDEKTARLQELRGAACDAVFPSLLNIPPRLSVCAACGFSSAAGLCFCDISMAQPARLFIRSVEPEWCNATADGLKPFECTPSPVLNILVRGDWVALTKKGFCTDIGGSLRVMAVCRIQSVVQKEVDRQKLLAMIPHTLHQALLGYLDSRGKPAFNYAIFDIVFDVRALKINVAALLEEGKFEDPLRVVRPGKIRPDNLGRGLVHADHGSCSDLVMYLEAKGCPKSRS